MGNAIMRLVFVMGVALLTGAAFLVVTAAESHAQEGSPTNPPGDVLERGGPGELPTCESIGHRELENGFCVPYIYGAPTAADDYSGEGPSVVPENPSFGSMDMGAEVEEGSVSPEMWEALKESGYRGQPGDGTDSVIYAPGDPRNGTYPNAASVSKTAAKARELPRTGGPPIAPLLLIGVGLMGAGVGLTYVVIGRGQ